MSRDLHREIDELRAEVVALRREKRPERAFSRGWARWASRARPLLLLLTLVIGVPVVLATDRFADVPAGVHHDDVTKLATAGITVGCGVDVDSNPIFCPQTPVTREQMASFLVRGLPRIASVGWDDIPLAGNLESERTVDIEAGIPGTALSSTGFIRVDAAVAFDSTHSRPCEIWLGGRLQGPLSSGVPGGGGATVAFGGGYVGGDIPIRPQTTLPAGEIESVAITWSHEVGPGTYRVSVIAYAFDPAFSQACGAVTLNGDVNVMYIPFDADANNDTP